MESLDSLPIPSRSSIQNVPDLIEPKSQWAEESLRVQSVALEACANGIIITDRQGIIQWANPAFTRLTGYEVSEAIGKNPKELIKSGAHEPEFYQQMWQTIVSGKIWIGEVVNRHKNGTLYTEEMTITPVLNAKRQITHFIAVKQDISDRKLHELEHQKISLALQKNEANLTALIENTDGSIWSVDTQYRLITGNTLFRNNFEKIAHRKIKTGESVFAAKIPIHISQQWKAYYDRALGGEQFHIELQRQLTVNLKTIWIDYSFSPIKTADKQVVGVTVFGRDITEQKQIEETMRGYERIVAATPDEIALIDHAYTYLVVNQTYLDLHCKRQEEIINHSVSEVLGEEIFQTTIKPHLDQALIGKVVRHQEWFDYPELGEQFIGITYAPYIVNNSIAGVVVTVRNLTDLKRAELILQQQAEQEHLLSTITHHIRKSLDLTEILNAAVTDVLSLLDCDRVFVLRLYPDNSGKVEAEALLEHCSSLAGEIYFTNCLTDCQKESCLTQPYIISNKASHRLIPCPIVNVVGLDVQSQVLVPITHQKKLWGFLVCQKCDSSYQWKTREIDLLTSITNQMEIAIHQSYLYQQVQEFNLQLESKVRERTTELWQSLHFEALLKRITDKVRDSLDEQQILQTVVQELVWGVEIECCDTGIYNADQTVSTISHEFTRTVNAACGKSFLLKDAPYPEVYFTLFQGEVCHFCELYPNPLRTESHTFTILACPIQDDQGVLGDLWLFKRSEECFSSMEIRLVQQVANQCAISLRQSRLYQAAQAQVRELERLNQLKDDFLSTVSHELRTPMSNIKMAVQMLEVMLYKKNILDSDAHITQYFQILNQECQQEITLINDLLDFSHLDARTEPLLVTTSSLNLWISAIAESFEQRIDHQNQQLLFDLANNLPPLSTDFHDLERVLSELLNNACKYTPEGGKITIATHLVPSNPELTPSPQIQICISNTGADINPLELTRIFDKFYRIPNNDPWKYGGTGLGLALVRKRIERLQGSITAESQDGITRFILKLPLSI